MHVLKQLIMCGKPNNMGASNTSCNNNVLERLNHMSANRATWAQVMSHTVTKFVLQVAQYVPAIHATWARAT